MNPELDRLQPYPFERLRSLLADQPPPADLAPIALSIGEPQDAPPALALEAYAAALPALGRYPTTRGSDALRNAIALWLSRRYRLPSPDTLAARHVLPVNGTREALFAIVQCLFNPGARRESVLMPNPFYQIYEGAALLAGAEPDFYALDLADADSNLARIDDAALARAQAIYVCNPGNPTGSSLSLEGWRQLIERARRHDTIVLADECYSEIHRQDVDAPIGVLEAAHSLGLDDYAGCLAFHSLSKRSGLPGLRSGFVAGDARLIERFLLYRTYHGCSMPLPAQAASVAAWEDEAHVHANRARYDARFDAMLARLGPHLPLARPVAGFYLWPELPEHDEVFARRLFVEHHVTVLPGSYLARKVDGHNPGARHIRLALVAPLEHCIEAAERIVATLDAC